MADLRVPDLNHVFIAGRMTRDPELKYTANGKPYCKVGLVNTRYFKDATGERKEDTTFVDGTAWGPQAEFIGERIKKGRPVLVEASLKYNEWQDNEGNRRSKLDLNIHRLTPLDWEDRGGDMKNAPTAPDTEEEAPF